MSNESFEELIGKYNSVTPDAKNEEFGKLGVIEALENIKDSRVLPFLLKVLTDENEYDLARVETAKILEFWNASNLREKEIIAKSLMTVLSNFDDDYLVRQWVAIALSRYGKVEGVYEFSAEILFNTEDDEATRHNLLEIFTLEGATEKNISVLRRLLNDVEFHKTATRILKEWGQEI